ncbi:hypothetical protein [Granulicella sp. L46]|uniref:hypothetical protein n=1 Tax=Granulicella sp. L46 TaxID=1641865 RepID=UPI00131D299F|nr:hypothetical protein [Granulicella sp. L46]
MDRPGKHRLVNIAAALLLAEAAATSIQKFMLFRRDPLAFDDAYMFLRYARNIRHGFGFSWNLDSVHTYGPTSLLWSFCAVILSYIPTDPWTQLILGSWFFSIAAVLAMAWAVTANAQSDWLRSPLRALALIAVPLFASPLFQGNQFNGMETTLATTLCALFVGLTLLWRAGRISPAIPGAIGLLLFLARPESALITVLLPLLLWLLLEHPRPALKSLLTLYSVFFAGVLIELIACQLYFGTPVPLSVYMKGGHAYLGYGGVWYPSLLLIAFLTALQLFLAALILLARRRDVRLVLACLLPVLLMVAYLGTVTQIMGFYSRYYVPYSPLIIVPAILILDRWLTIPTTDSDAWSRHTLRNRGALTAVMLLFFLVFSSEAVKAKFRHHGHGRHDVYVPAQFNITASAPLPNTDWKTMMLAVTDDLIAPLPPGITVASSEVGYLGERASRLNVIDLAGLNDTDIALHGFNMSRFLARKPDLIWMPHNDYTYQRGIMFSDPAFLAQYDLYAGAGNFGVAVRKDSSARPQIEDQLNIFWSHLYPGTNPSDYLVHSVTWSGLQHSVPND